MRSWNDDPFTKKARREDYAARSVYKLEEIDRRERVLSGAKLVVDLGAAPGSWTQYVIRQLPTAQVVAIDLKPLEVEDPRVTSIVGSIEDTHLEEKLAGRKADVVLSDMAPQTSGIVDIDIMASMELVLMALNACERHLRYGGHFVAKLFMGAGIEDFEKLVRKRFQSVRMLRPEGTRKHSREIFFIAKGYRGVPAAAAKSAQ